MELLVAQGPCWPDCRVCPIQAVRAALPPTDSLQCCVLNTLPPPGGCWVLGAFPRSRHHCLLVGPPGYQPSQDHTPVMGLGHSLTSPGSGCGVCAILLPIFPELYV